MKCLVVHDAFSHTPAATKDNASPEPVSHARGEMITDPATMQAIRDAGLGGYCAERDIDESFFVPDPTTTKAKPGSAD